MMCINQSGHASVERVKKEKFQKEIFSSWYLPLSGSSWLFETLPEVTHPAGSHIISKINVFI